MLVVVPRLLPTCRSLCFRLSINRNAASIFKSAKRFYLKETLHWNTREHVRLDNKEDAAELLNALKTSEQKILYSALSELVQKSKDPAFASDDAVPLSREQMKHLFIVTTLPFIGFGILDNLIMIVAGEYIDASLGVALGISTMAAAGLGNIISDIAGVGSAHYVEWLVARMGVKVPALSAQQWDSSRARWTVNAARAFGLTVGCFIGMFPLLFYDESNIQEEKMRSKGKEIANE